MKKISLVGVQARDAFINGATYLEKAISATLGPFGLNAYLEHGHKITNDGYSISAELANSVENEFERQGALTLHNAASKTNDVVGDATTSSIILTQAIIKDAVRLLPNDKQLVAKKKPSEILKMLEVSKQNVIEKLKAVTTPIASEQELIASAKVSVENDGLATLIGSAQWKIGKDGFIVVEETNETTSSVQMVKGIRVDNGFGTPFLITNQAEQSLELTDASILLTNYVLHKQDILNFKKIIDQLIATKKNKLIIVARAFDAEAVQLCMDSIKSGFLIAPLNAPYVYQSEIMRDLSAITGATYYDTEERQLEDLDIRDVGFCTSLKARRFDAIITGVEDNLLINDSVQARIKQLEEKLTGVVSDFERKGIQARIAQFQGGFAILKIGADTVFERQYKKDKAEDGVNSVRLALQGGTVKGAGLAFKEISDTLPDDDILKRPLMCIYNQIMGSAPDGFVIEDWVRDPYLTLVSALTNACSVAGQFASINAIVTTKDKKDKDEDE